MADGCGEISAEAGGEPVDHHALRAEPRDSMFLAAMVRRPSGPDLPVKVRNLSPGGMMAECTAYFARGEEIVVELRGIGWVPGRIAWSSAGRFGMAFAAPIDPKLARKPVAAPPPQSLVRIHKSMCRPGLATPRG